MKNLRIEWLKRKSIIFKQIVVLLYLLSAVSIVEAEDAKQEKIYLLPGFREDVASFNFVATDMPSKAVWQALVCSKGKCNLTPTALNMQKNGTSFQISKPQIQSNYSIQNTLIYISGLPINSKPIITYFTPTIPRSQLDTTVGTIGTAFNMPTDGLTRILPRWNQEKDDDFMTLYLEQHKTRQAIAAIPLKAFAKDFNTRDILIWAGDIDGDGKLDLITRNRPDAYDVSSESGELVQGLNLWLSSKAAKGELVGLASKLDHWETIWEEEY